MDLKPGDGLKVKMNGTSMQPIVMVGQPFAITVALRILTRRRKTQPILFSGRDRYSGS